MKTALFLLFSLALVSWAKAEDLYLKNGKVVRVSSLRRDGNVAFVKLLNPPEETSLIAINQIDRIVFPESAELREAALAAQAGDAQTVLIKTAAPLTYHNQWHDVPGNARMTLLRLAIPALICARKNAELKALLETWLPTGDPDLEATAQLLKLKFVNSDPAGFEKAALSATTTSPGTLCAAVSWLEQGNAYLSTGQWPKAVRSFLSVRLFSQSWRLFQAPALLGAIEACRANDQIPQSIPLIEDLQSEFPGSKQALIANGFPKPAPTPTAP